MRFGYVVTLAWLFLRSARQLATASGVMLAVTFMTATVVVVNAFALSGDQVAQRDLGVHDHSLSAPIPLGDRLTDSEVDALLGAVRKAGGLDPALKISSFEVVPDPLPRQHSTGRVKVPVYTEAEAVGEQFPGSYRLESGRWPTRPGEVVLSGALWEAAGKPGSFTIYSGAARLRVTGTATPLFGESSWRLLAAPGSWQTFPARQVLEGFSQPEGQVRLYWSGTADPRAVASEVAQAASRRVSVDQLLTGYQSRRELVTAADAPLTERLPLIHTYPSLALTALVTLLMVNLNRARLIGALRRLTAVGLQPSTVRAAMVTALLLATAAAVVVGTVLGLGAGVAVRRFLVPVLSDQPLSPIPPLADSVTRTALAAVVACVLGAWLRLHEPRHWGRRFAQVTSAVPWRLVRSLVAGVLLVRGVAAATGFPTLAQMGTATFQIIGGLLILTPDLLRIATRGLSSSGSVTLTARRLVESDRSRHALAATTLACCISVPTAVATLYATEQRTEQAQTIAAVPVGQIWVNAGNSTPRLAAQVAKIVSSTPGTDQPSTLGYLSGSRFGTLGDGGAFGILVLPSVDALRAVHGGHPPQEAIETLTAGGVLDWSGATGPQRLLVESKNGKRLTPELPTAQMEVDPAYRMASAGAILQKTAERLGLLVQRDALYVFTDLDDSTIRAAVQQVTERGYDPKLVGHHVPPLPTEPSAEWYLATVGLSLTGFAVLWAVQRAQARHLRDYAARLLAIGLGPRWSLRVQLAQALLALVVACTVAIPAGAIPIALLALNTPIGLVLDVPLDFIGLTIATSLAAAVAAVLMSLRALRPGVTTIET